MLAKSLTKLHLGMKVIPLVSLLVFFLLGLRLGPVEAAHHGCQRGVRPNGTERLRLYGAISSDHRIDTTTCVSAADASQVQALFNLGMALTAGYNQPEARRTFRSALQIDNLCPMCWWGVAHARGPFQNKFALQQPPGDKDSDSYFSELDSEKAIYAIGYAAALVGLIHHNQTNATMDALKAQLQQAQQQGQQGQGPQPQGQIPRLMDQLPKCESLQQQKQHQQQQQQAASQAAGRRRTRLSRRLLDSHNVTGDVTDTALEEAEEAALGSGVLPAESGGFADPPPPSPSPPSPLPPSPPPSPPPGPPRAPRGSLLRKERYYIAAMFDRLSVRATWGPLWEAAERRYAEDMRGIAACFPHDPLAPALAAEALANLSPWDFVVNGSVVETVPRPLALDVIELIRESLKRDASQPLALHLMIHVTEQLPARKLNATATATAGTPEYVVGLALESANRLLGLLPGLDHLQHMPSHTYVRLGMWREAVQSNVLALRASVNASWACMSPLYPDHDVAMGVFAATMAADYGAAQVYARVLRELPRLVPDTDASVARLWPAPLLVAVAFGNWSRVATEPLPPVDSDSYSTALGQLQGELQRSLDAVPKGSMVAAAAGGGQPGDVFDDPALDGRVLAGVLEGYAARNGGGVEEGSSAPERPEVWRAGDYSLKSVLGGKDASGPDYPRAVWLYGQAMALADQLHRENQVTDKLLSADGGAGGGTEAGSWPPAPPPVPLSLETDKQAAALIDQAQEGLGVGGAVSVKRNTTLQLLDKLMGDLRVVSGIKMRQDPVVAPGSGLGVAVPGYRLMAEMLYKMAEARVAFAAGNKNQALQSLKEAVELEDSAGYNEPPRLTHQPARQCLGWVQLKYEMYQEAVRTYLDDLQRYPGNAWSVSGLLRASEILGHQSAAKLGTLSQSQLEALKATMDAAAAALDAVDPAMKDVARRLASSCPAFTVKLEARR